MTKDQKFTITVLQQQANEAIAQMQAAVAGDGHNGFIQKLETIREDLDSAVSQATNGDATWPLLVDEEPDWGGDIPFTGEVSPHETRAREAAMPLTGERFNERQREMARKTGTSPLAWK